MPALKGRRSRRSRAAEEGDLDDGTLQLQPNVRAGLPRAHRPWQYAVPMTNRSLYTNSPRRKGDYAMNFFMLNAARAPSAQLACPFFTTIEPLEVLRKGGCRKMQLLVRLCRVTSPSALAVARKMSDVHVRYFTADTFHAKFYILGDTAMLGSANLTGSGLMSNREIAITLDAGDELFDELPAFFDDLWDAASVLTDTALDTFARWHKLKGGVTESDTIEGLEPASPVTVNVATQGTSRERTYLETFRREYNEILLPAHAQVRAVYLAAGQRHPSFQDLSIDYEIDRFLNWAKLEFTTDENLHTFPLLEGLAREAHIADRQRLWLATQEAIDF
jgi:phosphatidylserine/phosphatidylglycerophosphate/cardiolipin synthase-like enzyme